MKSAPTDEDGQADQSGEDGLVAPELHLRSEVRGTEVRGKHRRRCCVVSQVYRETSGWYVGCRQWGFCSAIMHKKDRETGVHPYQVKNEINGLLSAK